MVRDSEPRVSQCRGCVHQLCINAHLPHRGPLQSGATGNTIIAPQCSNDSHSPKIARSRPSFHHVVGK